MHDINLACTRHIWSSDLEIEFNLFRVDCNLNKYTNMKHPFRDDICRFRNSTNYLLCEQRHRQLREFRIDSIYLINHNM